MSISYSQPLSLGWARMKKALFQPFDLTKWFKVGFTAWLAGLTNCQGNAGGNNIGKSSNNWDELFNFPQTAHDWLLDNPLWFNLIIVGVIFLIIVISIFMWLSSRGKFMFLHNVVHDKSEISEPWKDYSKQGNSLFGWNFIFGWIVFAGVLLFFINVFTTARGLYFDRAENVVIFWEVAKLVLVFLGYIIIVGYISRFTDDFVVAIMYKHKIGVLHAWSMFLKLLGRHFFAFIIYGLFYFVLGIAAAIAVIFFALVTCCVGLLLLIIPVVGAVILLPISYTFRGFSAEFLAQFGENYNVFPLVEEE